jgi:Ca-activated chloride channel family protein
MWRLICFILLSTLPAMEGLSQTLQPQQQNDQSNNIPVKPELRSDKPIVITSNLVSLRVSVTDSHGRSIAGLSKDAFTIYDENVAQEISYFSDENTPASVAIVFDVSASMSEDKIKSAKEALALFLQMSHRDDEYFLINFSSTPRVLLEGVRDAESLLKKFTYVQPHGNTAIYDAVYLGIEKLSEGIYTKRALILISDGEDNSSRYTFNELHRRFQEAEVTIYTIQVGIPLPHSNARQVMNELASVSMGKAFAPGNRAGMQEVFEQIALELRYQYSLAYFPSNFVPDGRKHQVKVNVKAPDKLSRLTVRHRKYYYAEKE